MIYTLCVSATFMSPLAKYEIRNLGVFTLQGPKFFEALSCKHNNHHKHLNLLQMNTIAEVSRIGFLSGIQKLMLKLFE